jgi:site-specific DNA-adenine methylase
LGVTSRHAKALAEVVNPVRAGRTLWDPFCGGLASAAAFGGDLVCSDIHPGLIALYREVQRDPTFLDAFEEPGLLTRELFAAAKASDPACPVATLLVAGGCFGGDLHGGGYQRAYRDPRLGPGRNREFLGEAVRALRRDVARAGRATFHVADFLSVEPFSGSLVLYLDPPYENAAGYASDFDHGLFWRRARAWARFTDVWVSEYDAPDFADLIWEACSAGRWANRKKGLSARVERLWKVRP